MKAFLYVGEVVHHTARPRLAPGCMVTLCSCMLEPRRSGPHVTRLRWCGGFCQRCRLLQHCRLLAKPVCTSGCCANMLVGLGTVACACWLVALPLKHLDGYDLVAPAAAGSARLLVQQHMRASLGQPGIWAYVLLSWIGCLTL